MSQYKGVAGLCFRPGGRQLLMVLQGMPGQPPTWMLPGGPVRPGETPEAAMQREALEDAGLSANLKGLYKHQEGTAFDSKKRPYEFVCHYFEIETPTDKLTPQDPDRLIYRAEWIEPDDFKSLGLYYDFQREIIEKFWAENVR